MNAIDKLREITNWCNWQNEYINQNFKSIKGIEQAFNYAREHDLEFIDNDYLLDNFEGKELETHLKAIKKFQKL
jgi:hypothetical protein